LEIAEKQLDGAGRTFFKVVGDVAPELLPGALVPKINFLAKSDPRFEGEARELVNRFEAEAPDTEIGKAAKRANKKQK